MSIRISAGPRQVEPQVIERALEDLWISLPRSEGAPGSLNMRAVMANLLSIGGSDREIEAAMAVVGNVIGRNPCRVIAVKSEPDIDPPELTAEVAVICQDSKKSQRSVCCDQIRLSARGIMADNLPSLTATLFVPDLPVVVWWPKPPFARKDFELFAKQATRVVVDSAGYALEDLSALARFVEQARRLGVAVSDLNWGRLTPYRQLFAQFFDSMECRCHLDSIAEVRVAAHTSTGRLLAGWLKAQIDKTCQILPGERIRLVAADPGGPSFQSLTMTCSGGENTFSITRKDKCMLEAGVNMGPQARNRVVKAVCQCEDALLSDEITLVGRDAVFEAAVAVAAEL